MTLAELEDYVGEDDHYRCTASFVDPSSTNPTRCIIRRSPTFGCVQIWIQQPMCCTLRRLPIRRCCSTLTTSKTVTSTKTTMTLILSPTSIRLRLARASSNPARRMIRGAARSEPQKRHSGRQRRHRSPPIWRRSSATVCAGSRSGGKFRLFNGTYWAEDERLIVRAEARAACRRHAGGDPKITSSKTINGAVSILKKTSRIIPATTEQWGQVSAVDCHARRCDRTKDRWAAPRSPSITSPR